MNTLLTLIFSRRNDKTHVSNYTVKKKVVIKPRFDDSDGWSDVPTGYDIHIETVGAIPGRPRLSSAGIDSDLTTGLSEYEIDIDPKWEIDRNRYELILISLILAYVFLDLRSVQQSVKAHSDK